jgi:hypothetical protein
LVPPQSLADKQAKEWNLDRLLKRLWLPSPLTHCYLSARTDADDLQCIGLGEVGHFDRLLDAGVGRERASAKQHLGIGPCPHQLARFGQ